MDSEEPRAREGNRIVPYARDFGNTSQMAEREVLLAYVMQIGPLIFVTKNAGGSHSAELLNDPSLNDPAAVRAVYFDSRHYRALVEGLPDLDLDSGDGEQKDKETVYTQVSNVVKADIIDIAQRAQGLTRLPPPALWSEDMTNKWTYALTEFSKTIPTALAEGKSQELLRAFHWLPSQHLLPLLEAPASRPVRSRVGSNDSKVRGVMKQLSWKRPGEAMKRLLSNGIANDDPRAERIMREMHPRNPTPLVKPDDLGPGLNATTADIKAAMTKHASCHAIDYSGWAMDLFKPVLGVREIMQPMYQMFLAVTNCTVSEQTYWYVTPGSLVAGHKLAPGEQTEREMEGLDPKLRPINKAGFVWKLATTVGLKHKQAQLAASKLQPIQMGMGAVHGMARIALTCQDLYARGYSSGKSDAFNGFNEASRQAMLDAIRRECGALLKLFWMGYCSHAPLVLFRTGGKMVVLTSEQGSRMGCCLGNFGFCLAVQPAYNAIKVRCPRVVLKAATDDLVGAARDPVDVLEFFTVAAEELKQHAGITCNSAKSELLLHKDAVAPEGMPENIKISRTGMIIVGAAVGEDEFIAKHIQKVVDAALQKTTALHALENPQAAMVLLASCMITSLCYHLQVTPPRLALSAA
jgi:hypothetical protein